MTHCLNCGAERYAEVCESCGLSSTAAEFSLRRRLLNRTAFFVLGALAFVAASGRFPPLELDSVLIFIGALFFPTLGLAVWVERRALRHAEVEALKRVYYGLVPLPWLLAALLLANGALDRGPPKIEEARVVGKFAMAGALPTRRLVVTSWREGHRIERVPVDRSEFDRFSPGDFAEIKIEDGLVGIPWVAGVSYR
ncbi:MAG TPA: hypothetical protein VJO53_15105 [Candidatus Acidoferrales bacterium]|nr:hypothetical protein [Candidatus Acidoferrales bacterium]